MSSSKIALPSAASVLQLGSAADLMHGLRPIWSDPARDLGPVFAPPAQPFRTFDLAPAPAGVASAIAWSGPVLTLHADVGSLLDALFDYRVLPFAPHSPGFDIPARVLLLPPDRRDSSLAALGTFLGLDLAAHAAAGGGFVLLKMRRVVAEHIHEAMTSGTSRRISIDDYWTAEARNAMRRLRVTRRIVNGPDREAVVSEAQASRYLDYFKRFGTHFITRVELGELLVQILAIHPARSQPFSDLWQREARGVCVTGLHALGFRAYLDPRWIATRGRIVSVGDNPALTASLEAGDWHEGEFVQGGSLLEALTGSPAITRALAAPSRAPSAIAIDFAPQSSFMEVFRADGWKRLLKGAMLQRFGSEIRIPPPRQPPIQPVPARTLPRGELRFADAVVSFNIVAEYCGTRPLHLPGRQVLLCAYRVIALPHTGQLPIIRLEEATLDHFEFIAGTMSDALFVIEAAGDRRDTICEGFRFTNDAASPNLIALRVAPSGEANGSLSHLLESAWPWMEALRWQPVAADFARGFFEWLAAFWHSDPVRQRARLRALNLAKVTNHPSSSPSRAAIQPARLLEFANDAMARAVRARVELRDPETAPDTLLHACAIDFARLADRAEKLLLELGISSPGGPADDSGKGSSESFEGFAQIRHLYEEGRLFAALLRLTAALDEPGGAEARPDGFDLLAAAEALVAAAQTKGNIQAQESSFVKASET